MRIKKLRIKRFGTLVDREFDGGQFLMQIEARNAEEHQTLSEVILALLFGFSPHRRSRQDIHIPQQKAGQDSASLVVETENSAYLIGRNFALESLEVFKCKEKRLLPLSPTTLMDVLYNEVGTLNPLDFEVTSLFAPEHLRLNQHAPLVREHVQQLIFTEACRRIVPQGFEDANFSRKKQDLEKLDQLRQRIEILHRESTHFASEEQQYASYEKFLSTGQGDLLQDLSSDYMAATLERSFCEEQLREEKEARKTIEREAQRLRVKIAAFDRKLYTTEIEQKVIKLLKIKEQQTAHLAKEEAELTRLEGKGLFFRLSRKELITERKLRIEKLLQDLARIRDELKVLLKGKRPQDFFADKTLLEQYCHDLLRLEHPTIQQEGDEQALKRLLVAKEKEKNLHQQLDQLLELAGQEELEKVKTKVKGLSELKQKKKIVDTELKALLTEIGSEHPEQAILYLEQKKKEIEDELKTEAGELPGWGDDPVAALYHDASTLLKILTAGQYKILTPHLDRDQLGFIVSGENGEELAEQLEPAMSELVSFAFRLALSRQRQVKEKALIILSVLELLTAESKTDLLSILQEWFAAGQIILIENSCSCRQT